MRGYPQWRWHLDEVFVKVNGRLCYLWRAVDHLITFTSSAGSLFMRLTAPWFLRRLGFRRVLVWFGLAATLLMTVVAVFRPDWPLALICLVLFVQGFFQSLQFIGYNTIAYADVSGPQMSTATGFYTPFQQLSLALGVAISAAALAGSMAVSGHGEPQLADFSHALLSVAFVSLFAPLVSSSMEASAGSLLSGHRSAKRA